MEFMDKFLKGVGVAVVVAVVIGAASVLGAYPTKWLFNYLFTPEILVAVFGGPLTFWKALALNYVSASLFKGTTEVKK